MRVIRDPWINQYRTGRILNYARAASTGPIVPLALTPTRLDDQMNVGVTYRTTGFSRAKIDGIMSRFLEQIEHPDGVSCERPTSGRNVNSTTWSRPNPLRQLSCAS